MGLVAANRYVCPCVNRPASVVSLESISKLDALVLVALTFGGTVALVIFALGMHSGSVINPAMTLAVASAKLFKRDLIVPYLFFQILGGVLARFTPRLLFPSMIDSNTYLG